MTPENLGNFTYGYLGAAFGIPYRGIAYSINKTDKPVIEFLTELEQLSENGWYYYKADYNEWRTTNSAFSKPPLLDKIWLKGYSN